MSKFKRKITEKEFERLCEYVCGQMTPTNSSELDRETLYFAIYWKICDLTGEKLFLPTGVLSKISDYRGKIRQSVGNFSFELFDASGIADRVIERYVENGCSKQKAKFISEQSPPIFLNLTELALSRTN